MKTSCVSERKWLLVAVLTTALLSLIGCGAPATPPPTETLVPTPTQWFPPTSTPTATPSSPITPTMPPREIVLTAPEEGATIGSPVEVRGRVSVMPFEANLRGRVYDAERQVVGEAPIQAQSDVRGELGGPGIFTGTIPFQVDATGPGQVEVAEISARDGSIVVSATAVVTLTSGAASAPAGEPTKSFPAVILTREGAIAHSLNLLREQGIDWWHDNANFAEVRFPDGDRGAVVAVGFSGIAQGYQLLYRVDDGEVVLADFISGPIDWGIWSLRDFETSIWPSSISSRLRRMGIGR